MRIRTVLLVAAVAALSAASCQSKRHQGHGAPPPPMAPMLGMAHQDHAGKHGGSVQMFGDLHTETVFAANGKHLVFVSDAARNPLPAATIAGVTLTVKRPGSTPEKLVLTPGPDGSSWVAAGQPLSDSNAMVRLDFTYRGKPQFIDVPAMHLVGAVAVQGHAH